MSTPTPLTRLTWPAAELVAAHPPRFSNENKERVHAIACPPGAVHAGTITATRWDTMPLPERWQRPTIESVEWHPGPYDYVTRREGACVWHVNFADPNLFFGYGTALFAQDELQCAEHPALASVREAMIAAGVPARTADAGRATPVLVAGVERRCEVRGLYGHRFGKADAVTLKRAVYPLVPAPRHNILAIAALSHGDGTYTAAQIRETLTIAYTGFRAAVLESDALGVPTELHTGFWGCGAFGGNREVMVLLQWLAASAAGVTQLVMHVMDDAGLALGARVRERVAAMPAEVSLDELVAWVAGLGLRWGVGNGT
jgi:hypothetical protein